MRKNKICNKITIIAVLLFTSVFSANCYVTNIRFTKSQMPPAAENAQAPEAVLNQSVKFPSLWFGVKPLIEPVKPLCNAGQNLKYVTYKMDVLDNIIHFIAGGIYTRRTVYVYCG